MAVTSSDNFGWSAYEERMRAITSFKVEDGTTKNDLIGLDNIFLTSNAVGTTFDYILPVSVGTSLYQKYQNYLPITETELRANDGDNFKFCIGKALYGSFMRFYVIRAPRDYALRFGNKLKLSIEEIDTSLTSSTVKDANNDSVDTASFFTVVYLKIEEEVNDGNRNLCDMSVAPSLNLINNGVINVRTGSDPTRQRFEFVSLFNGVKQEIMLFGNGDGNLGDECTTIDISFMDDPIYNSIISDIDTANFILTPTTLRADPSAFSDSDVIDFIAKNYRTPNHGIGFILIEFKEGDVLSLVDKERCVVNRVETLTVGDYYGSSGRGDFSADDELVVHYLTICRGEISNNECNGVEEVKEKPCIEDQPTGVFSELTKHQYLCNMVTSKASLDVIRYGNKLPEGSIFLEGTGIIDDLQPIKVFNTILLLESGGGYGLPEGRQLRIINTMDKLKNIMFVLTVAPSGYEIYKLESKYDGGLTDPFLMLERTGNTTCKLMGSGGNEDTINSRPRQFFKPHYSFGFYEAFVRGGDLVVDLTMCDLSITKSYMLIVASEGTVGIARIVVKVSDEETLTIPAFVSSSDSLIIIDTELLVATVATEKFPRGQFNSQINQPFNNTYLTEGELKLGKLDDIFLTDISGKAISNKEMMLNVRKHNPFPKDEEGNTQPLQIVTTIEMPTCFAYFIIVNRVAGYVVLLNGDINDWYRVPIEGFNYYLKYGNVSIMTYGNPPRPVISFSRTLEQAMDDDAQNGFAQTKVYSLVQ